jgi:hypothetical protein
MPQGAGAVLASFLGTAGVLFILAKAIKRVIPIALEPFQEGAVPLNQWQTTPSFQLVPRTQFQGQS